MIYKTLIVLDTNKLWQGNGAGKNDYSRFEFGGDSMRLIDFIKKNDLSDYIKVAIPEIVIRELENQKRESFVSDQKIFNAVRERMEKIGYKIKCEDVGFCINNHLSRLLKNYLKNNPDVVIIENDESKYAEILGKIIERAINKEKPFKEHGKSSDVGFKDVLIWETVLYSDLVKGFEKVYFFSNDEGFSGCEKEFEKRVNKYCEVIKEISTLETSLESAFREYLDFKEIYKFIKTEYFKEKVKERIVEQEEIDGLRIISVDIIKSDKVRDAGEELVKYDTGKFSELINEYNFYAINVRCRLVLNNKKILITNCIVTIDEFNEIIEIYFE